MIKTLYQTISFSVIMYVLLGIIYPYIIYFFGNILFPNESKGSIISINNIPVGSRLIGQGFLDPKYFWSRPSAAGEKGYDAINSNASNLATTNKELIERMNKSIENFLKQNPTINREDIPPDLVTTSASGLDPEISFKSAKIQIPRIAKIRNLSEDSLNSLLIKMKQNPTFGFIGSERVNVLLLNLELDNETKKIKN